MLFEREEQREEVAAVSVLVSWREGSKNLERNPKKKSSKQTRKISPFSFFFKIQKPKKSKKIRYNADGAFAASVLLCLMALGTLYVKDKLERKAV